MFPKELDDATVFYYTGKNEFGIVANPDGTDAEKISYLAICKYEKSHGYYLFLCDENFEVVTDEYFYTIDDCFAYARSRKKDIEWYRYT